MVEALKITSRYKAVPPGFPTIKPSFNDYTWAEIKQISDAELWNLYGWQVGDKKEVSLNFGDINGKAKCFILGFNHNYPSEAKGISLQFADYKGFKIMVSINPMDTTGTISKGWEGCSLRTTVCQDFYNSLPPDLQSVIKETTKYSNNLPTTESVKAITATKDKIFIPSLYEITEMFSGRGTVDFIPNPFENNFQKIYDFYKFNNSIIKYKKESASSEVIKPNYAYWTRTNTYQTESVAVSFVQQNNVYVPLVKSQKCSTSLGFAPAFVI